MEAMAIESMLASLWELEGFLPRLRWPVRQEDGYSDFDVVAVDARRHVRVGECKARGPAQRVFAFRGSAKAWLDEREWGEFIEHLPSLWASGRPGWLPPLAEVAMVEVCFCGNLWFPTPDDRRRANDELAALIRGRLPNVPVAATFMGTRELFFSLLERVRAAVVDDELGKRFGNPLLDALREVVRYANPKPARGGRVADEIRSETLRMWRDALDR